MAGSDGAAAPLRARLRATTDRGDGMSGRDPGAFLDVAEGEASLVQNVDEVLGMRRGDLACPRPQLPSQPRCTPIKAARDRQETQAASPGLRYPPLIHAAIIGGALGQSEGGDPGANQAARRAQVLRDVRHGMTAFDHAPDHVVVLLDAGDAHRAGPFVAAGVGGAKDPATSS